MSTPVKRVVNPKDEVLSFLQQGANLQWGFSRKDVHEKLRDILTAAAADNEIEILKEDGPIYETKDEDHFKFS